MKKIVGTRNELILKILLVQEVYPKRTLCKLQTKIELNVFLYSFLLSVYCCQFLIINSSFNFWNSQNVRSVCLSNSVCSLNPDVSLNLDNLLKFR